MNINGIEKARRSVWPYLDCWVVAEWQEEEKRFCAPVRDLDGAWSYTHFRELRALVNDGGAKTYKTDGAALKAACMALGLDGDDTAIAQGLQAVLVRAMPGPANAGVRDLIRNAVRTAPSGEGGQAILEAVRPIALTALGMAKILYISKVADFAATR